MSSRRPFNLTGQQVLIIGASTPKPGLPSGIGWEMAQEMALQGAKVVAVARWSNGIPDTLPEGITASHLDLDDWREVETFADSVEDMTTCYRVVCLVAGQLPKDDSPKAWYQNIMMNLVRPGYLLLCFIAAWLHHGKPAFTITVTSSFGTKLKMRTFASYLVAKVGMEMLVLCERLAYPDLDLRLIWPGIIETGIWDPDRLSQLPSWYNVLLMWLATSAKTCGKNIVVAIEKGVSDICPDWQSKLVHWFGFVACPMFQIVEEVGLAKPNFLAVLEYSGWIKNRTYPWLRRKMMAIGVSRLRKQGWTEPQIQALIDQEKEE